MALAALAVGAVGALTQGVLRHTTAEAASCRSYCNFYFGTPMRDVHILYWVDTTSANAVPAWYMDHFKGAISAWNGQPTPISFAPGASNNYNLWVEGYKSSSGEGGQEVCYRSYGNQGDCAAAKIDYNFYCDNNNGPCVLHPGLPGYDSFIAAHELGHASGLAHSPQASYGPVMSYGSCGGSSGVSDANCPKGPNRDDVNGLNALYNYSASSGSRNADCYMAGTGADQHLPSTPDRISTPGTGQRRLPPVEPPIVTTIENDEGQLSQQIDGAWNAGFPEPVPTDIRSYYRPGEQNGTPVPPSVELPTVAGTWDQLYYDPQQTAGKNGVVGLGNVQVGAPC